MGKITYKKQNNYCSRLHIKERKMERVSLKTRGFGRQ